MSEELIMSGLIERAARALYQSAPHDFDPNQMGEDATWPDLVEQARAVLQAIREPSEAMMDAGGDRATLGYEAPPRQVWQAMLDAALNEA